MLLTVFAMVASGALDSAPAHRAEDSRYVGLTMPRTLMRLPYGKETVPTETFNFEEDVDGKDKDELEAILGACVEIIRPLPGSQRLVAEFEMLQLNLVNLR